MSTAHRPTWAPAIGHEEQRGNRMFTESRMASKLDMPDHHFLKFRQRGQGNAEDLADKEYREDLEAAELRHFLQKRKEEANFDEEKAADLKLLEGSTAKPRQLVPNADDADDNDASASESEEESEDDEDEEAALLAELERIKKEKAEEAAKKAAEEAERRRKVEEEQLIASNPLLQQ